MTVRWATSARALDENKRRVKRRSPRFCECTSAVPEPPHRYRRETIARFIRRGSGCPSSDDDLSVIEGGKRHNNKTTLNGCTPRFKRTLLSDAHASIFVSLDRDQIQSERAVTTSRPWWSTSKLRLVVDVGTVDAVSVRRCRSGQRSTRRLRPMSLPSKPMLSPGQSSNRPSCPRTVHGSRYI